MCIDIVDLYKRRNFYQTCQELIIQFVLDQTKIIVFGTGAENHKVQGPPCIRKDYFLYARIIVIANFFQLAHVWRKVADFMSWIKKKILVCVVQIVHI